MKNHFNQKTNQLKVRCFQCSKSFLIKFVISRQTYSQKNNWNYWTGIKSPKKICNACLRNLYYDKPTYWTAVKDPKKRALFRVYLSAGKI